MLKQLVGLAGVLLATSAGAGRCCGLFAMPAARACYGRA